MAADDDFEVVDGLAEYRERFGIGFGDSVRIRSMPETERLGYAGLEGQVFGETVPSESAVEPIVGTSEEDFALYVHFEQRDDGAWFAPELVQFLHHSEGMEFELEGGPKVVRDEHGNWREVSRSGLLHRLLKKLR